MTRLIVKKVSSYFADFDLLENLMMICLIAELKSRDGVEKIKYQRECIKALSL